MLLQTLVIIQNLREHGGESLRPDDILMIINKMGFRGNDAKSNAEARAWFAYLVIPALLQFE